VGRGDDSPWLFFDFMVRGLSARHVPAVLPGIKYAFTRSNRLSADEPILAGSGHDCRCAEETRAFLALFFFIAMLRLLFFPAGNA